MSQGASPPDAIVLGMNTQTLVSEERALRFALLGAGGYVAPRHMKAISETGHRLVAACDPNDSVGILDRYFSETQFFQAFERFDRHLSKLKRQGEGIDVLVICSPNYLHDAHIRFALRLGAHAICEKPLVISEWNLTPLQELSAETGKGIFPILQLREHASIRRLKAMVDSQGERVFEVELTQIVSRGPWYLSSWKGEPERSGGLSKNIGIHLFDMLLWVFGPLLYSEVHHRSQTTISGRLCFKRAKVKWFLSIDREHLPASCQQSGQPTFRRLTVGDTEIDFTSGFSELHTQVYRRILSGHSPSSEDARAAIELSSDINQCSLTPAAGNAHSFLSGVS